MALIRPHWEDPSEARPRPSGVCPHNPKTEGAPAGTGVQCEGICQREGGHVYFTQRPETTGPFKSIFVHVDPLSGWVEAHPTRTEKVMEVAKLLLKEIILRFGLPYSILRDRGSLQKSPRT